MRSLPATVAVRGRLWPGFLLIIMLAAPSAASAQGTGPSILFSTAPSSGLVSPEPVTRGEVFGPRGGAQWPMGKPHEAQPPAPTLMVPAGKAALALSARFGKDAAPIDGGLVWRIFSAKPDGKGKFRLVKEDTSPAPTLVLPTGAYIVHVGFGLATAVRPVTLRGPTVREQFDLPAGGLRMEGRVGDTPIPLGQISFDVFRGSQFDPAADRRPIAEHVATGSVLAVPEGTYYIVSHYGDANAVVRSDIRVQAGKLTDVTVTHRAAAITLKLVEEKGGEALANTAWSVLTPGGDVIKESIGAFPRVILSEGEYRAIARNDGRLFEREFKVVTGVDGDVEVLAH